MAAPTKDTVSVVASTSNGAGSSTRGSLDCRTADGGLLSIKMTNGATGPTVQCTANVLVAYDTGTTPATGAAGSVWKTWFSIGGGTSNNGITEVTRTIPPGVMHLEVEFTGNTAQAVTVEANASRITGYA